jgi:NitT/TauT family transport system substrate-binding protein
MIWFGRRALLALPLLGAAAASGKSIRVGTLRYGSLHWELDVMQAHRLDAEAGLTVEIVELASAPAGQVALQAGRVDVVMLDWLWVSRQRSAGADWSFVPASCALGAVVGARGSAVHSLSDLPGRRLGIAGSPVDKSWLLLRAYALRHLGLDLEKRVQTAFAAPPLLAEQLAAGRLDAALTFWPFVARAQAAGLPVICGMDRVVSGLDVGPGVPFNGFVFSESWARDNHDLVDAFVTAARRARAILADSDAEWDRIAPLTQAGATERALLALSYRAGVPRVWEQPQRLACARLFTVLAETGGRTLIGDAAEISPGTFWPLSWSDTQGL